MKSITEHQHAFYASQPPDYRRGWWDWAVGEHNFLEMVKVFEEKDTAVLDSRERAIAKYRAARGK